MRNRRLYRRVEIDAGFEIDGAPAELIDLSMGGLPWPRRRAWRRTRSCR
jgi:hypothetical protein